MSRRLQQAGQTFIHAQPKGYIEDLNEQDFNQAKVTQKITSSSKNGNLMTYRCRSHHQVAILIVVSVDRIFWFYSLKARIRS